MVPDTSDVPLAACSTLRAISWVAAPCSSTAEATEVVISLIWEMIAVICSLTFTASRVASWMPATWPPISSVALAVWLARFLTSDATTAKPFPASPARAASMVAFRASRLVCSAMSLIRLTTSPMLCATWARPWIWSRLWPACVMASLAMAVAWVTWRLISWMELDSSSAAEATVCTLAAASSAAALTATACSLLRSAVVDISPADA